MKLVETEDSDCTGGKKAGSRARPAGEERSPGRKYAKAGKLGERGKVSWFRGFDIEEGVEVAWTEMPVEEKEARDAVMQGIEAYIEKKAARHEAVLMCWEENDHVKVITEYIGDKTIGAFVGEVGRLPSALTRKWAQQLIEVMRWMKEEDPERELCSEDLCVCPDGNIKVRRGWLLSGLLGKEDKLLGGKEGGKERGEEKQVYSLGILLLAMAVGEFPEEVAEDRYGRGEGQAGGDGALGALLPKWIVEVEDLCLQDLIVGCLRSPGARMQIEDARAHHFFDGKEEMDVCTCAQQADLSGDQGLLEEDYERTLLTGDSSSKQSESIYDQAGGVEVKATSVANDIFSFQMHFFKTSKSVSFYFNRKEDTVESVVREMEDEGLAEEQQMEAIKEHMEKLICRIRRTSAQRDEEKEEQLQGARGGDRDREDVEDGGYIQIQVKNSPKSEESSSRDREKNRESSDDGIEYPATEYRDALPITDFVMDVAAATKRVKSTAESWASQLKAQDVQTVGELRLLVEEDWKTLGLPVFASRAMKNMLYGEGHKLFREGMQGTDEALKEYKDGDSIEELLVEVAERFSRSKEVAHGWLGKIRCQDIRTIGELKLLHEEDWKMLELTVFSHRAIRNAIFRRSKFGPLGLKTSPRP